ncbi:hypothetical protein [Aeoliella mucimassa]|uniref:Uncharacterized protein n=1 Tax=Aeoliella mucimassa TaxID=2527972 RepID=A0A518ATN4_9BACT|nr:hypothetical protein [Aeoliella mucimassa]QDU58091.1 hypothetical protein Pan181_43170 [Aeoliella mucimassa]
MICKTASFEQTLAPPQEDLPRPMWTRLNVDGIELTNSVEYAGWHETPSELSVCESCWSSCCAMQNLAVVARLGEWLACFPADLTALDAMRREIVSESNLFGHVLLFEPELWRSMQAECQALPAIDSFPGITRGQLLNLWLRQLPQALLNQPRPGDLRNRMESLLASDPLSESEAVQRIDKLLEWVNESPHSEVQGSVAKLGGHLSPLNTLHFDGHPSPAWTCCTATEPLGLVLDHSIVFEVEG